MKRTYLLFAVVAALTALGLLFVACQPVQPVQASGCSLATLKGSYGTIGQGQIITTTDPIVDPIGPFAGVGPVTFDGAGGFKVVATLSLNGAIVRGIELTGTYSVNADCTATSLLAIGVPYDMVIVDRGHELYAITTTPGRVYTFMGKRID